TGALVRTPSSTVSDPGEVPGDPEHSPKRSRIAYDLSPIGLTHPGQVPRRAKHQVMCAEPPPQRAAHPANGVGSTPRTPGLATNTAPARGPPAPSWFDVVMNSWSRSAPPKVHALVWLAPSTSMDSSSRPLTGSRQTTRASPQSATHRFPSASIVI